MYCMSLYMRIRVGGGKERVFLEAVYFSFYIEALDKYVLTMNE